MGPMCSYPANLSLFMVREILLFPSLILCYKHKTAERSRNFQAGRGLVRHLIKASDFPDEETEVWRQPPTWARLMAGGSQNLTSLAPRPVIHQDCGGNKRLSKFRQETLGSKEATVSKLISFSRSSHTKDDESHSAFSQVTLLPATSTNKSEFGSLSIVLASRQGKLLLQVLQCSVHFLAPCPAG